MKQLYKERLNDTVEGWEILGYETKSATFAMKCQKCGQVLIRRWQNRNRKCMNCKIAQSKHRKQKVNTTVGVYRLHRYYYGNIYDCKCRACGRVLHKIDITKTDMNTCDICGDLTKNVDGYQWSEEGIYNLIGGILRQARTDYHKPAHKKEVEKFINSDWFTDLTESIGIEPSYYRNLMNR